MYVENEMTRSLNDNGTWTKHEKISDHNFFIYKYSFYRMRI